VENVRAKADSGLGFSAQKIVATATPFNPLLWVLESAQSPALSLPGGPASPVQTNNLQASLRLNQVGPERISVTFDGLEAQGGAGWKLGPGAIHLVSDPKDSNILAFRADLTNVEITKPLEGPSAILGQKIRRMMMAGPISEGQALLRSSREWTAKNGKLTIMAGELLWGPISFTDAKGEIGLTGGEKWQGRLEGKGALKPDGIAVAALSGPVNLSILDNKLSLNGLPGINISNAFGTDE
jgi:hypothetical protein